MHISIATEHILQFRKYSKSYFQNDPSIMRSCIFLSDAYAVPGVRGTPLPLLHRQCLPRGDGQSVPCCSCAVITGSDAIFMILVLEVASSQLPCES